MEESHPAFYNPVYAYWEQVRIHSTLRVILPPETPRCNTHCFILQMAWYHHEKNPRRLNICSVVCETLHFKLYTLWMSTYYKRMVDCPGLMADNK